MDCNHSTYQQADQRATVLGSCACCAVPHNAYFPLFFERPQFLCLRSQYLHHKANQKVLFPSCCNGLTTKKRQIFLWEKPKLSTHLYFPLKKRKGFPARTHFSTDVSLLHSRGLNFLILLKTFLMRRPAGAPVIAVLICLPSVLFLC